MKESLFLRASVRSQSKRQPEKFYFPLYVCVGIIYVECRSYVETFSDI